MSDTYELDEGKNLISANNGVIEDQLNTWKTDNFNTGTYNNAGTISLTNTSSLELNSSNIDLSNTQFGSFGTGSLYATKTFGLAFGYNYTSDQYFYNRTSTNIRFWTFKFNSTESTDIARQVVNAGSSLRMMKAITSAWDYFLVGWVLNNMLLEIIAKKPVKSLASSEEFTV